ncbi:MULTISPECIES: pseudaminic acid biosynthesis-associated methylase [unclassified Nostoc]|uniref:pseudaminic acid biosynthesis-associated methylase n=1 Tax=unclassified Nostoc TaxID=2593658 RepID=UPI002AD323DE|nr:MULTISPECIES: pseudaminic acid biosynthesis-associated methylase [unclassified Nostoc]MDZ8123787.1 pseudaminic acid biosynthesis-associated methylase [Nostoc sp. CmiVER01]MDZ8221577.1 pseudaminic acid biosynthesis-associated methylase [Nostoc sp. ChiVER01]
MVSNSEFRTEQEYFWAGKFGDEYIARNKGNILIANNISLFTKILSRTHYIHSLIEFGANIGLNLQAIRQLLPEAEISAVEINQKAVEKLQSHDDYQVYHQSIFDFVPERQYDLTLIKGVLIHISSDMLTKAYELLYQVSNHYICIAEYYNPTPVKITYRGHQDKLFKRDFAGEMLDKFHDLRLLDYGFVYHRDSQFPQDDLTWFLLEKTGYK